jgi:hypothetical protein
MHQATSLEASGERPHRQSLVPGHRRVLNSRESYESGRTKSAMRDPVDPLAVAQLQRIIDETGCTVVLSSSWRIGRYLSDIRGMLIKAGARHPFPLIDKTPDLSRVDGHLYIGIRRGEEVKAWVDGFEPNVLRLPRR